MCLLHASHRAIIALLSDRIAVDLFPKYMFFFT